MPPHLFIVGKPVYGAFFREATPGRYAMKKLGTVVKVDVDGSATLDTGAKLSRMTWPIFTDREEARKWADENPPKLPFGER